MKKFLGIFLILFFTLPAVAAHMPHDLLQVMHDQKENHHKFPINHTFSDDHTVESLSHSIHFDAVSFFSDYLHVDLKNADSGSVQISAQDTYHFDYFVAPDVQVSAIYPSDVTATGPPEYQLVSDYSAVPLYLSTQRIRI